MELKIAHLYPDVLNLYGDRGNILCMERRLGWRGIDCTVTALPVGSREALAGFDFVIIGGEQDFDRAALLPELASGRADELRAAVEDGMPALCICGGYQLLGSGYRSADGQMCEYTGILDLITEASGDRMVGNYAFRLSEELGGAMLPGFENHSGRTRLGSGLTPLGTVLAGHGNNGQDGTEGVHYKNVFGTYAHGPLLPNNPAFCDLLLRIALERKYGSAELAPLDDSAEIAARDTMLRRMHLL